MANVQKLPPTVMSNCGTTEGAVAHDRRGQQRCRACKDAWNQYYRQYRALNRGTKTRKRARTQT